MIDPPIYHCANHCGRVVAEPASICSSCFLIPAPATEFALFAAVQDLINLPRESEERSELIETIAFLAGVIQHEHLTSKKE